MKDDKPDPADGPPGRTVTVRLLCTTDLHAHLLDHDYHRGGAPPPGSLARLAPLIEAARAEAAGPCLLFDCGDALQGTPLADWAAARPGGETHPVIAAMNALRYDAMALGNHDFNYGIDTLRRALDGARFPVVASNLGGEAIGAQGTALLTRPVRIGGDAAERTLRIGLLGLVPPQILDWDGILLRGRITAGDMVAAARETARALREAGADLVVGLAHTGFGADEAAPGMENALIPLSRMVGVDVWFGGHTHEVFASPDAAAPPDDGPAVVLPGCFGSHLGVVDLTLRAEDAGWRVGGTVAAVRPAPPGPVASDPAGLRPLLARAHAATVALGRQPVCETAVPLHTHFARFAPSAALDAIAGSQRAWLARRLSGGPWADLPVLAAVAPFRAGGPAGPEAFTDIAAGRMTETDVTDLYPYTNAFCAVLATGRDLRRWLERSAAQFLTVPPGSRDGPLLDPQVPGHNFDLLHGVTVTVDLSRPALFDDDGRATGTGGPGRVADLRHEGRPVADDDRFAVATNSYRVAGGGGFPRWSEERRIVETTDRCVDILAAWLREAGRVSPAPSRWLAFAPLGATATVETGPGALEHADEAERLGLSPVGPAPGGFLRWRLQL